MTLESLIDEAASALTSGRPEEAITLLERFFATNTLNGRWRATFLMALARQRAGDPDEALRWARRAVEWDDSIAEGYLLLGDIEDERGRPEEALVAWECAARLDPRSPRAFWRLADARTRVGRAEEGREAALTALRLAPEDSRSHSVLGYTLHASDPKGAHAAYTRALALDPNNVQARTLLAQVSFDLGRIHEGLSNSSPLLASDSTRVQALTLIGSQTRRIVGSVVILLVVLGLRVHDVSTPQATRISLIVLLGSAALVGVLALVEGVRIRRALGEGGGRMILRAFTSRAWSMAWLAFAAAGWALMLVVTLIASANPGAGPTGGSIAAAALAGAAFLSWLVDLRRSDAGKRKG